jgi:hypothetical protein
MPDAEGIRLLAVITQRAQNARTMAAKKDKAREDRIVMEIVVDAYGPEERAMGWYCHLDNTMSFPFTAQCTGKRATSPLKKGDEVAVIGVAPEDDCQNEMFVTIRWEEDDLAVPLSQLEPVRASAASRQAVEDWLYWVKMGYEYYLFKDQGDSTGNVGPAPETHKRQQLKLGKGVTFVKSHLRRLPQSAEIWEADIRPAPAPGNKRMIWEGLVISHDGRMPSERMFEEPATVNDMAVLLADAMRRPTDGEPRRPKTLRIRKPKEWADLLPHLKQIGIQVISAPRLASSELQIGLSVNASATTERRDSIIVMVVVVRQVALDLPKTQRGVLAVDLVGIPVVCVDPTRPRRPSSTCPQSSACHRARSPHLHMRSLPYYRDYTIRSLIPHPSGRCALHRLYRNPFLRRECVPAGGGVEKTSATSATLVFRLKSGFRRQKKGGGC